MDLPLLGEADLSLGGVILLAGVGGLDSGGDFALSMGDSLSGCGDFTATVPSITCVFDLGGVGAPGR